jgi:hypothetical protein
MLGVHGRFSCIPFLLSQNGSQNSPLQWETLAAIQIAIAFFRFDGAIAI